MPTSGTYIIRAGTVTANTGGANQWTDHTGGSSLLAADAWGPSTGGTGNSDYSGFFTQTPGPNDAVLRFGGDSAAIFVDGSPIAQASLPAGFTPTSATVRASIKGVATYHLQFDAFTQEDGGHNSPSGSAFQTYTYAHPLNPVPSLADLLFYGFGIRKSILGFEGPSQLDYLEIFGAYTIQSTTIYPPLDLGPHPPATLPDATIGVAYTSALTATGGGPATPVYTFTLISGALPTGLAMNSATGAITGTPTVAGTSTFSVRLSDALPSTPVTGTFQIRVGYAGGTISPTSGLGGGGTTITVTKA